MTFGVIARIHWQALHLWIKRAPLFRQPEPPARFVTPGDVPGNAPASDFRS
jgi:hypothetical protein